MMAVFLQTTFMQVLEVERAQLVAAVFRTWVELVVLGYPQA
jgi:hypothetical protein